MSDPTIDLKKERIWAIEFLERLQKVQLGLKE